ncbi:hypothetical protein [Pseudoalteromonas tunicata]|uniref:Uncharacterized protein n=1 Tax=Pseudoalteromonas tunicata D2 TaxID=87626 RepID=A4CCY4_9GAMM|nr:hypothetical protein [Pseudoalteromonas tunicata]ATC93934.1 hypothetical protein PTUN_a1283 [Pseudoalteromonas tunicata]AXT29725.1 hypothetical protein D1819_02055 [Pseudoalteromonas tunicata]EAR27427.1 hypothetical protein PTD2_15347 [Pseudoalteromonas tunicata D2]
MTVWQPVTHISIDSNAHQIIAARLNALKRKRYFLVCIECGFRHVVGHMHDADICQGCASNKHGVMY